MKDAAHGLWLKNKLTAADVTAEAAFWNRRQIMAGMAAAGVAGSIAGSAFAAPEALVPNSFEDITNLAGFFLGGNVLKTEADLFFFGVSVVSVSAVGHRSGVSSVWCWAL